MRKISMPDTYVIVFFLIVLAVFLAYVIPAGTYQPQLDEAGKSIGVDPSSFSFTASKPPSVNDILSAFYVGLLKGAKTIFVVFVIGGVFQIIIATGSLDAMINFAMGYFGNRAILILPIIMSMMLFLGAVGIGLNVALVFIPIGVILCKKFKLDPLVPVAIFLLAGNTGFSASPINPFTVLLAQDLSGVVYMSGFTFRGIVCIVTSAIFIRYVMKYCLKIRKNPSMSLVGVYDDNTNDEEKQYHVKTKHILIFMTLIAAFVYYTWGSVKHNWGLDVLASIMVALGLFSGIVGRLTPNEISRQFVDGCKQMVFSAILIGLAGAITVILDKASVIHTIVYYLCIPLNKLPSAFAACAMTVVNAIINVFIPSGSAQAYVTIPIMAPMADVLGFSRQIAISAFQFGDGFTNAAMPTSSLLMGCLGIARVSFVDWMRFAFPLYLVTMGVCMLFLVFGVFIGWA